MKPSQMITVFIVDDHQIAHEGIRAILHDATDIEIVGEAENGNIAMEKFPLLFPQVVLLDLKMPGISAAEVGHWIRNNFPESTTLGSVCKI